MQVSPYFWPRVANIPPPKASRMVVKWLPGRSRDLPGASRSEARRSQDPLERAQEPSKGIPGPAKSVPSKPKTPPRAFPGGPQTAKNGSRRGPEAHPRANARFPLNRAPVHTGTPSGGVGTPRGWAQKDTIGRLGASWAPILARLGEILIFPRVYPSPGELTPLLETLKRPGHFNIKSRISTFAWSF